MGTVNCRDAATHIENEIRKAKHAYTSGFQRSINAPAWTYGIPYGTLWDWLGGAQPRSAAHKKEQLQTPDEEKSIVRFCETLDDLGHLLQGKMVKTCARPYYLHISDVNLVSTRWHTVSTMSLQSQQSSNNPGVSNRSELPVQSRFRFRPKADRWNRSYHGNNPDRSKWAGVTNKTQPLRFNNLAALRYLSSDHILTLSICRCCSLNHSLTSRCQICNQTNILWVNIDNPQILHQLWHYYTAIQHMFGRSHNWNREVDDRLNAHNVCIHYVTIWSKHT